jgi:hypothetical protein
MMCTATTSDGSDEIVELRMKGSVVSDFYNVIISEKHTILRYIIWIRVFYWELKHSY